MTEIPPKAFMSTHLSTVALPDSVTSVEFSSLLNCKGLEEIVIPVSASADAVRLLYENVVSYSLRHIYYAGTATEWNEKVPESEDKAKIAEIATVYFYVENEKDVPADGGNYWHYAADGKTPVAWNKQG